MKFSSVFLIFFLLIPLSSASAQDCRYDIRTAYEHAIPCFVKTVMKTLEDFPDKEQTVQWGEETSVRIHEFLYDLIDVMEQQAAQSLFEPSFQPAQDFLTKWEAVVAACPGCEDLKIIVQPLMDDLFKAVPPIRDAVPGEPPLANMYDHWQRMEALNPWGMGAFWRIEFLEPYRRDISIRETMRETTSSGFAKTFIVERKIIERYNNRIIFTEQIKDDQVLDVSFAFDYVTFLHEVLHKARNEGVYEELVEAFENVIDYIEGRIILAQTENWFDDFTYYYWFDPFNVDTVRNELLHNVHPLLKDPYNQEYKTAVFYPRQFYEKYYTPPNENPVTITLPTGPGFTFPVPPQAFPGFDPQHQQGEIVVPVKRMTRMEAGAEIKAATESSTASDEFETASKRFINFWSFGIVFPLFLYSVFGFVFKPAGF